MQRLPERESSLLQNRDVPCRQYTTRESYKLLISKSNKKVFYVKLSSGRKWMDGRLGRRQQHKVATEFSVLKSLNRLKKRKFISPVFSMAFLKFVQFPAKILLPISCTAPLQYVPRILFTLAATDRLTNNKTKNALRNETVILN